jgi:DNA-binding transcriptional ArsR family regulator
VTSSDGTEWTLQDIFGNCPRAKILDALLGTPHPDMNVTDISEESGVARSTIYQHLDALQSAGVIEKTRDVGGGSFYAANSDTLEQELDRSLRAETDRKGGDS